jgi:hypothetical protein
MKFEAQFLIFLGLFGAVVALVYGFLSDELAGTVMLGGFALLGLFPGGYYLWWHRRIGMRAEDDPNAELTDGAGVVGVFPSSSIWPFVLGLGCALVAISLVFGFWTALPGFFLVISAVFGVVSESRHGGFSRH